MLFLVWYLSAPVLNFLVTHPAEMLVDIFDTKGITRDIVARGGETYILYYPSIDGKALIVGYRRYSYGIVLLVALILAVPDINRRLRLNILLIGLAVILSAQVLRLTGLIFDHYAQHILYRGEPVYPLLYRQILHYFTKMMLRLEGHVIPVAIWVTLFIYYHWYRDFTSKKHRGRAGASEQKSARR